MSVTDELLDNARRYAEDFDKGDLPLPPAKHVAVVACMDARLNVYGLLGLSEGDAHVIRNAGGVVTEDEIRSPGDQPAPARHPRDRPDPPHRLRHADLHRRRVPAAIQADTGIKPTWSAEAFDDLDADVRQCIARITADPFIPHKDSVRGFVYDVTTGELREVS